MYISYRLLTRDRPLNANTEDTSPTESAMLEPDSPKNAGEGKPDKEGGALVIPEKATVGENTINKI